MARDRKPPRVVGLLGSVLINLNSVIGAGIFALPAVLYSGAGTFAPVAILGFAAFYACLAAVPAKLSTLFDQSGGAQLYVQHSFGDLAGYQIGWFYLCANMTARAANMHVLVSYLAAIFPVFEGPIARPLTLVAGIGLFMTISIVGTKRSIEALYVGTALKLVPLAALCLVGLYANGIPADVNLPVFSELEAVILVLAYAFSGSIAATVTAGESKDPRTDIFRSILINLAVVAVVYATIQLAYIAIAPDPGQSESPLAAAGEAVFGPAGAVLVGFAAVFSIATNQLNSFVVFPRIMFGMARRGLLPRPFAYVSPRFRTPAIAILVYSLITTVLALTGTFAILATLVVAVEQLIYLGCVAALIAVGRRNEAGAAGRMGPHWVLIIVVTSALIGWLLMQVPARAVISTLLLVAIGFVLYGVSRRGATVREPIRFAPPS